MEFPSVTNKKERRKKSMEQFYVKPLGLEEYPAPDVAIFEILGMRFVIAYTENVLIQKISLQY